MPAKSPAVAAGAPFTATQQNRSGLSISWRAGSSPTNASTGDLDMNPLKKGSSTVPPEGLYLVSLEYPDPTDSLASSPSRRLQRI